MYAGVNHLISSPPGLPDLEYAIRRIQSSSNYYKNSAAPSQKTRYLYVTKIDPLNDAW
jgi:hypothetical protein